MKKKLNKIEISILNLVTEQILRVTNMSAPASERQYRRQPESNINDQVSSILIKQYESNSTSSFTFDKHSTIYIYSERSYVYLGMSRVWIETSRSTRYGRRSDVNFHGFKRIRPIGKMTIAECFQSIDIEKVGVQIHNNEIYVPTPNIRAFIISCFDSFFLETCEFDKKKYGENMRVHKRMFKHIY